MSEFSNHKAGRVARLTELFQHLIQGEMSSEKLPEFQEVIDFAGPADVIAAIDQLVLMQIPMSGLKKGINKGLNLLNKSLQEFPYRNPAEGSFLDLLIQNNTQTDLRLKAIRPLLKEVNLDSQNLEIRMKLKEQLLDLSKIDLHYQIKENMLFPRIEKYLPDYRCLQVMWSFHDDIRKNLKEAIRMLDNQNPDLKILNRLAGDLFFNIYAVKFREERILFPVISGIIPEDELDALIPESLEIGFPFVQPQQIQKKKEIAGLAFSGEVDLQTGFLTPEQIRLVFNHLPVDITYVDENDEVKFFSTPEKRIFRRTKSIIGRDVKNCHPHESLHVVEQIVNAFRKGEKDRVSFWIQMKGEFILIQYFAVRDEDGNYRGVVEVSQEITEIRNLQGEKRLLDWNN